MLPFHCFHQAKTLLIIHWRACPDNFSSVKSNKLSGSSAAILFIQFFSYKNKSYVDSKLLSRNFSGSFFGELGELKTIFGKCGTILVQFGTTFVLIGTTFDMSDKCGLGTLTTLVFVQHKPGSKKGIK
jgi:hypothetical protein